MTIKVIALKNQISPQIQFVIAGRNVCERPFVITALFVLSPVGDNFV